MNFEWCYYKQIFSEYECEKILQDSENYTRQNGTIGTQQGYQEVNSSRRSIIRFVSNDDSKFTWVFDKLWNLANSCNQEHFFLDISHLDYLQIAEYHSDNLGQYSEHHDVAWINNPHPRHRKLSATVNLSKPNSYTGGDFKFTYLQYRSPNEDHEKEMREQGTAIFFPSFIPHAVLPVTSGIRYSITAWFEGPKWR